MDPSSRAWTQYLRNIGIGKYGRMLVKLDHPFWQLKLLCGADESEVRVGPPRASLPNPPPGNPKEISPL
jgi:hypothetical protein